MKVLRYIPLVSSLIVIGLVSFAATSYSQFALISVAAASPASAPEAPAAGGLGLLFYAGLAVGVIGGALRILDVLIGGLRWLAPRTRSTADDTALAFAEAAHERLDELDKVLERLVERDATPRAVDAPDDVETSKIRKPQGGFVRLYSLLLLACAGLAAGCGVWAAVKTESKALADGVVTCAKADKEKVKALGLQLGTEALAMVVTHGAIDWDVLSADAEAGAKGQGIEIAACAFGGLISRLNGLFNGVDSGPKVSSGGPEPFVDISGGDTALRVLLDKYDIAEIR